MSCRLIAALLIAAWAPTAEPAPPPDVASSPILSGLTVSGEQLFAATCTILGMPLQELRAVPRIEKGMLTLGDLSARGFGGQMRGEHQLSLIDGTHQGTMEISQVDLVTVIRHFGGTAENLAGAIKAHVAYRIDPSQAERVSGKIELEIVDARLFQLPVLLDLLAGDPAAARGRDRLYTRLEFHGERIDVLVAELTLPSGDLRITGTITLGGDLDLRVSPKLRFRWADALPGIGSLLSSSLGRFSTTAGRVRIRGHISKPVIVYDTF